MGPTKLTVEAPQRTSCVYPPATRRRTDPVPVTSNIARIYPFQVKLSATATGLRTDSKAQAEQVRSVAVQRVGPRIGRVPADVMEHIDEAVRLHLAL